VQAFIDKLSQAIKALPQRQKSKAAAIGALFISGSSIAMSPIGTFETCRPMLPMSVHRGRPEVTGARSNWR
jgi:hypothetical protein